MSKINEVPDLTQTLPGRPESMTLDFEHAVFKNDMREVPEGCEVIYLGLGCFWGAERLYWQLPGVENTAVGYAGGLTLNPNYDEVCSGHTGHCEAVRVVYNIASRPLSEILKVFWEAHDPTQGMRQGNDVGTQYRSAIYGDAAQLAEAEQSKQAYQSQLNDQKLGEITTELKSAQVFYYAEQEHQQYLYKNPMGYCGLKGTGVVCPI